jgi:uncharacterized protein YunC (DUF1805 family)
MVWFEEKADLETVNLYIVGSNKHFNMVGYIQMTPKNEEPHYKSHESITMNAGMGGFLLGVIANFQCHAVDR